MTAIYDYDIFFLTETKINRKIGYVQLIRWQQEYMK